MSITIRTVKGSIIKDSRGKDTVRAEIVTTKGALFAGAVPSGQSVGGSEIKTQDPVDAVDTIDTHIRGAFEGKTFSSIDEFDSAISSLSSFNSIHIGANAHLPVSIAATHALARSYHLPTWQYISEITGIRPSIPTPMMVMIEGGKHGAFQGVTWQEFLLNAPVDSGIQFLTQLTKILDTKKITYTPGVEGGISIDVESNDQALELFLHVFHDSAHSHTFSIDCAATHSPISSQDLNTLTSNQSLMSIEDPASEEEWDSWSDITKRYGSKILIVGDDLTTTNYDRLHKAIDLRACNALIIKPNQIGSVSQTLKTARLAHRAHIKMIVSHRAGETTDTFIADLGVGIGALSIKSGAPTQKERIAKYMRLEQIKKEM